MVLSLRKLEMADNKDMAYDLKTKIDLYIHEIHHFIRACEEKISTVHDVDQKEDIKILHDHAKYLHTFASNNLKTNSKSKSMKKH